MQHQTVPYFDIAPNSYNPNVMPARVYQAELESIAHFGFIDPVTVREVSEGLSIVDGEHRWRAFRELRELWMAGALEKFHDDLLPMFEANTLPVVNLGVLSDTDAKKLTVILNETRGRANTVDLAALLAEIGQDTGAEELRVGLPYSDAELSDLLQLAGYDWNATASTAPQEGTSDQDETTSTEEFRSFTATLPEAAFAVYTDAIEKVKQKLAEDGLHLPEDGPLLHGQVVELLAAEFLAGL